MVHSLCYLETAQDAAKYMHLHTHVQPIGRDCQNTSNLFWIDAFSSQGSKYHMTTLQEQPSAGSTECS